MAGLGYQSHVLAPEQGLEQGFQGLGGGMLVQFQQDELLQWGLGADALQEGPGCLGMFDDESGQPGRGAAGFLGQHLLQGALAQGRGNQVEGAGGHVSTSRPSLASISVNLMRGSPTRALGSSVS